jgi:hypothetical protein
MKSLLFSFLVGTALTASASNMHVQLLPKSTPRGVEKIEAAIAQDDRTSIRFTLKNNSAQSIPLIIPNVMNPNLSPFSSSGVELVIGQKIFFKEKGKKYLLLIVDAKIATDAQINVDALLIERKKDLGL